MRLTHCFVVFAQQPQKYIYLNVVHKLQLNSDTFSGMSQDDINQGGPRIKEFCVYSTFLYKRNVNYDLLC